MITFSLLMAFYLIPTNQRIENPFIYAFMTATSALIISGMIKLLMVYMKQGLMMIS